MTLVSGSLQAMGAESIDFLGRDWSLRGFSGVLLYLFGVAGEVLVLTSIYLVMPVGRPSWRHALVGAVAATVLWEITRHVLVWYFGTLSQVAVVYGSLTTRHHRAPEPRDRGDVAAAGRPGHRRIRAHRHEKRGTRAATASDVTLAPRSMAGRAHAR